MSSTEFQKSLDMGSTQQGVAIVRATLLVKDKWVDVDLLSNDPAILNGGTEASAFFARRSQDPARAKRLSKARKKLGNAMEASYGTGAGLVTLRMKAGLSQAELAQRMNTQQPSIARWERSPEGISFSNMQVMAKALGVTTADICAAIEAQSAITNINKVLEYETA